MTAASRTADEIIADWHAGRADHDPYDEIGGLVAEVADLRYQLKVQTARAEMWKGEDRITRQALSAELAATEGDLGVAIREAAAAREALRFAREFVDAAPCQVPGIDTAVVLSMIDGALDQRLTQ